MAHGIPVRTIVKIAVATVLIAAVAALFLGPLSGLVESLSGERVSAWVNAAGAWGPTVIILLMTVAIVATPLQPAPGLQRRDGAADLGLVHAGMPADRRGRRLAELTQGGQHAPFRDGQAEGAGQGEGPAERAVTLDIPAHIAAHGVQVFQRRR